MKPLHELDALCAEKVAGWTYIRLRTPKSTRYVGCPKGICNLLPVPRYTTDPAAVLGLLEKEAAPGIVSIEMEAAIPQLWRVSLSYRGQGAETDTFDAEAPTFALAATLALLKAHGCEVGE